MAPFGIKAHERRSTLSSDFWKLSDLHPKLRFSKAHNSDVIYRRLKIWNSMMILQNNKKKQGQQTRITKIYEKVNGS